MKNDARIKLNVGGAIFITGQKTLKKIHGSLLASLTPESEHFDMTDGVFYFDRDSEIFAHILNAYRTGSLHIPNNRCPTSVEAELDFWRIPRELLSECCWKTLYQGRGDLETTEKLKWATSFELDHAKSKNAIEDISDGKSTKEKIWLFLEEPASSKAARIWHMFYGFIVILSTLTFIMWAEPGMRVEGYLPRRTDTVPEGLAITLNKRMLLLMKTDPHPVLFTIDILCLIFFSGECAVHVFVSPSKYAFFKNRFNVGNLILVMILLLAFILEVTIGLIMNEVVGVIFFILKTFSVFRLLLLFKLYKMCSCFKILLLSFGEGWKDLMLLVVCYSIAVVIFGGLMYCADIYAGSFESIFSAMWWALITITTVGYGDYYPTAVPTYIIGSICATLGIVILALPIAIIASNFSDFYNRNNDVTYHIAAIGQDKEKYDLVEDLREGNNDTFQ